MSPNGLVKVARAGPNTSASADSRTLLEVAATGRLTTKNTLPTTVATKQSGRTTTASATTIAGSGVVSASAEVVLAIQSVTAQTIVINLVFMVFSYTQCSLIVEIFAMMHRTTKSVSENCQKLESAREQRASSPQPSPPEEEREMLSQTRSNIRQSIRAET